MKFEAYQLMLFPWNLSKKTRKKPNFPHIIQIFPSFFQAEFKRVMERDMATMEEAAKARKRSKMEDGRKRDPGLAWILDFNNDGIVSVQEMESADQVFQGEPAVLPKFGDGKEEL